MKKTFIYVICFLSIYSATQAAQDKDNKPQNNPTKKVDNNNGSEQQTGQNNIKFRDVAVSPGAGDNKKNKNKNKGGGSKESEKQ